MFFKPQLPIQQEERELLDTHFAWVVRELGVDYLKTKSLILDTHLFDFQHQDNENTLDVLSRKIMSLMDVDPNHVEFILGVNDQAERAMKNFVHSGIPGAGFAGRYRQAGSKVLIEIEENQFQNPISLCTTIAHELSHCKLLREGRIPENDEVLTDMLPTFFGLGIFSSSSVLIFEQYHDSIMQGWKFSGGGYLSENHHGYLLAKWALFMELDVASVRRLLKTNVEDAFQKTLRYLKSNPLEK